MPNKHFISYSSADALDFALKLYDALLGGEPSIPVWLDKRELKPGQDWDEQIVEAIRTCDSLLFVMTPDSVEPQSVCKQEWTRALKYKKPIVPILLHRDADMPFRLGSRQYVDFTGAFEPGLARLRTHLQWLASPEGVLQATKDRLADAQRDLRRARDDVEQARIQDEIDALKRQIAEQQRVVDDPEGAARRVEESIKRGLERERQPEKPVSGITRTRFINPPPGVAPSYFQDRYVEMRLIGDFLKDESKRLMTVVGRAGIGKTIMVCRVLKSLEGGQLPEDGGPLSVDGIVYLSASGLRRVTVPNLYADLLKLLPDDTARELDALYKDPRATTEAKMGALLAAFPHGRVLALLDNFEDVIDPETHGIRDEELDEALRALLNLPHHAVNVILTTRIAPRDLALVQPGRQMRLELDQGLESPYAENILREMDVDGKVGLKDAPADLLDEARRRTLGYPRALEALFAILSADRYTTLREALNDAQRLLPEHVVEKLVGEAFNRLDPTAQKVMQALAVYARPVTPAAVDYLLQPYLPGANSAPVLNRLVTMHFARKEGGRYYMHQVDREYAFARLPRGEEADRLKKGADASPYTQFALWHRGAEYFKQARKPREEWKTIEDLGPQLAEFDLRCAGQDHDTAASVLLEIDFECLLLWGYYRLMVELHERLQAKLSDPNLKQNSVGNLGTAYQQMGQVQKAIACYEQALAMARETEDRGGEGAWLGNLGMAYRDLGEVGRAIKYHEQALVISREIGDRRGECSDLGSLGNCYSDLGQTARAIDYYEQALAIAREIGDRRGEGACLGNLGNCYSDLGQTARAIDYYEQALAIDREIGYRQGEAIRLGNLGNRYGELGQTARAIDYYEQALAIDREIGYRQGEAIRLGNLGSCYSDLGQTARAIDYCEQALAIAREIGFRVMESASLAFKGDIFVDLGELDRAEQLYHQAIRVADEISYAQLQNGARAGLASAHLHSGDLAAAHATAKAARQHDFPPNNHYVLALLGVIALRQGHRLAARQAFAEAVAQADGLLAHTAQNYRALDVKGLTLGGLALCGSRDELPAAVEAYRAARAINKDAGVVGRVLRLLDALALADPAGAEVLSAARAAAGGE